MGGIIRMEISNVNGDLYAHGEVQAHMEGEGVCIACGTPFSGEHTCTIDEQIMHTEEFWHKKGSNPMPDMENKEEPMAFTDKDGKRYVKALNPEDGKMHWVEVKETN